MANGSNNMEEHGEANEQPFGQTCARVLLTSVR